jgi:hypothetical protein
VQASFSIDLEDYPNEVLEELIDESHEKGVYPVVVIERFHTFARIVDDKLFALLSALRTREHAYQITTLAISPIDYDTIRRRMPSHVPFVNSVYGDNHDRAVMTPLSRDDFVAAATSRGLEDTVANRLFGLGGGPDAIYSALIDSATHREEDVIQGCLSRLGDTMERFLDNSFSQDGSEHDEFLKRLALGCLRPLDEAMLSEHLFFNFLAKRTRRGKMVASSPVLSRFVLRRGGESCQMFEQCLRSVAAGDFAMADQYAAIANPSVPHLCAFCGIVGILASLHKDNETGLLGIDWQRIRQTGEQLLSLGSPVAPHLPWIQTLVRWARLIEREAAPTGGGARQLDVMTARAAEPDIHELLLFSMSTYLARTRRLTAAAAKVQALANIPESILQALAAAYCGIDFRCAPASLPQLNYARFFGGQEDFRLPVPGRKMELTSLLVIVPTLLADIVASEHKPPALCDPVRVRPLQHKLVDRLRNVDAHTYADFSERDARLLTDLCAEWLEAMALLAGFGTTSGLPVNCNAPSVESLSVLLYGGEEP